MKIKKADIYFTHDNGNVYMTVTFKNGLNIFDQLKEYTEKFKNFKLESIYFREEEAK